MNVHYIPVYRQPYHRRMGFMPSDFPESERYYEQAISLPIFLTLDSDQQKYVIAKVREMLT